MPACERNARSQRAASSRSWVTSTKAVPLLARQLQHQLEHAVGGVAVEVAGGLVGQHAGRLRDQRAGDRHALALAARQLRRVVRDARRPGPPAPASLRPARAPRPRRLAADAQRHRHVVQRAELGQQVVELVDEAEVLVAPVALLGRAHASRSRGPSARRGPRSARRARPAGAAACSCPSPRRRRWPASRRVHLQVDAAQHLHVERGRRCLRESACAGRGMQDHSRLHERGPPQLLGPLGGACRAAAASSCHS